MCTAQITSLCWLLADYFSERLRTFGGLPWDLYAFSISRAGPSLKRQNFRVIALDLNHDMTNTKCEYIYIFFLVNMETMCADDLLSVLLYLLVKTEIPNWYVTILAI